MKNSDVVVGVLSGLAVGALLGVLFAPDKGTNTRRKIREGVDEAKENLNEKFSEVSDRLIEKAFLTKDDFEENLDKFVSNASHKTEDVITFLEEKLAALKLKNAKFQK